MQVSHAGQPSSLRPLITAPYRADVAGRLIPTLPSAGPCSASGEVCRIGIHHWRSRKTGPRFPLAVCECRQHGETFTLYPPGHVPYGRRPLLRQAPDGGTVRGDDEGVGRRRGTLFEPALDAAEGREWPFAFAFATGADGVRSTQRRRLRWLSALVGVGAHQGSRLRVSLAEALGVGVVLLTDRARTVAASSGSVLRRRGAAVVAVLERASRGVRSAFGRLSVSGYLAGMWGRPLLVGPRGHLRPRTSLRRAAPTEPG